MSTSSAPRPAKLTPAGDGMSASSAPVVVAVMA
jgi:hypothetical protein